MTVDRRRILKTALSGGSLGALVVPEQWVKPVVKSVVVPAHAAASPVTHVDKTDSPMLIVNSTNELVPKAQADAMKTALDEAGVANQEIILPGTAHSRAYANRVWDQTVTFLENYLEP